MVFTTEAKGCAKSTPLSPPCNTTTQKLPQNFMPLLACPLWSSKGFQQRLAMKTSAVQYCSCHLCILPCDSLGLRVPCFSFASANLSTYCMFVCRSLGCMCQRHTIEAFQGSCVPLKDTKQTTARKRPKQTICMFS